MTTIHYDWSHLPPTMLQKTVFVLLHILPLKVFFFDPYFPSIIFIWMNNIKQQPPPYKHPSYSIIHNNKVNNQGHNMNPWGQGQQVTWVYRGWWICWEVCVGLGLASCVGWGFSWKLFTAWGVKSLSPLTAAPETSWGCLSLGGLDPYSISSAFVIGAASDLSASFLCCTTRIPPTFTAGACPAFKSTGSLGGEDIIEMAGKLQKIYVVDDRICSYSESHTHEGL